MIFRVLRYESVSSTYPGQSVVRPSFVRLSVILSDFHSVSVSEPSQSVDMVADMVANMEVHMVANMKADMVADTVANM